MPSPSVPDIGALAASFGARADISARSVLVTIFGDSVVPTGGEIWLGDLIELCEPFGFNDRLVRTSMFRLAAEDWFEIERVGRRSRYRLSTTATDLFTAAEARIYHRRELDWDGTWTVALLDAVPLPRDQRDQAEELLRSAGFAVLSPGVLAAPRPLEQRDVDALARRAGLSAALPVLTGRFFELRGVLEAGSLLDGYGLDAVAARYRALLHGYAWTAALAEANTTDAEDFLARTMVVHDLRRARLADPELPAALLPSDWPAAAAHALAGRAYRRLSPGAWRWIRARSELATTPQPSDRFP